MTILTPAAFANALKILYPSGLEQEWYPDSPFLAWVDKSYDFQGASRQVSPLVAGINGSTSFDAAMAGKSTPTIAKFLVTRVKDYVIGSIDNEAIAASKGEKGAIAKAVKTQMDSAMYEFGRSSAFQAMSDGSGTRGTVSAYSAGVITLTDVNDAVKFEVGMRLEKKTSGGTLLAGWMVITAIDRAQGKLTVTLFGGAADPAATNTLARMGDYTATGSNCLSGVFKWIPVTAPTGGDNHFGQDRSIDVNRLAGTRSSGLNKTIEEAIIDAQADGKVQGGKFSTLWMHTKRAAELKKSIQSQAWYAKTTVSSTRGASGKVDVSFSGFVFEGEDGPIEVMSTIDMPYAYGLMTRREAWELASLEGQPHFDEQGGDRLLVETSADAKEFRLKVYWQLICRRPVDNVLISWDA
jgi:hypothetical protein